MIKDVVSEVPGATCQDCSWRMSVALDNAEYVAERAHDHAISQKHWVELLVNIVKGYNRIGYYGWTFSRRADELGEGLTAFKDARKLCLVKYWESPEREMPK